MNELPSVGDLIAEMNRLSQRLERALSEFYKRTQEHAEADAEYSKAHAMAYLQAEGTVSEREAHAALATSEQRLRLKMAEALSKSAQEAIRSRRQQLSACQSIANAVKAEIDLAGKGPEGRL